jgi:hypothetical protein
LDFLTVVVSAILLGLQLVEKLGDQRADLSVVLKVDELGLLRAEKQGNLRDALMA